MIKEKNTTSGELTPGTRTTPVETVIEDGATRINKFNAALNVAVDQARQQRKDKTLDFLGGVVPKGALPATSFAQIIRAFNTDSAPLESTLIKSASDFAQQQEQTRIDTQNQIKDLALAVGKAGGKQETIDAITALMDSGDIQSALKIAATVQGKGGVEVRQVGSNLVRVNPDGNVEVLYSAPSGGGGGTSTGFFTSGGLKIPKSDLGDGAQKLASMRGSDGFVNTDTYSQMYQHWVDNGGLPQDFFNQFDPDFYLNPNDTTVPSYIKSQMKQAKKSNNPFND